MSELLDLSKVNYPNENIVEEQGFFLRDDKNLFYAMYRPVGEIKAGAVLVSPFAEEKIRTHRIYVSLARLLASKGISVLHFDYFGDGDSQGNFEDALYDDRMKDSEILLGGLYLHEVQNSAGVKLMCICSCDGLISCFVYEPHEHAAVVFDVEVFPLLDRSTCELFISIELGYIC